MEKFRPWLSLSGAANLVKRTLGEDQNSASEELIRAATAITATAEKIEKTVPQILGNKMTSPLANATAARAAIARLVEPTMKRVEVATNYTNTAIKSLREQTSPSAPSDAMGAVQHSEVRAALLNMSRVERHKAVETALASGDETFLSAATSGNPMLTGMSAEEQTAARQKWRVARHPELARRLASLSNGLMQLERIAPMLPKWSASLVEEPDAATLAAAEATAAKAQGVSS